ncbi:MAG: hypothetical protein UT86_C0001G0129 [Candidatus Magasanikbacteria bacterium GW2011_GWC2_40_17]|uniref:Septum formation initiator n=1 Tax=Candidatus Magasanikbacteria bacterium GW2011_GWA2_42_32 TaxID=1619039 RepID=A0A0G1A958_9BACT|nr:MAG: hypothetical protein UT86_C0001G0129 [Candidatus Magasanikbacteria bacterium GW2011_GWC2_40_17]KKS57489.1 MAG: hypothetical protein UV20_C0001G0129 [Candidatus Magasanikbacteria bacterium GW2011_GWA2_42_32]OGH85205.1 MAG: hypothetical protein A2294_00455 [Candidatus Magasanikbacteria bacterium RIFOXYB2_FULL_38_10]
MQKRSLAGKIGKNRLFIVVVSIFLILFLIGFLRSFWRDYQIRKEIKDMQEERIRLEGQKLKTLDFLNNLQGDNEAEKEARLNFGLAKPGEQVVIIAGGLQKTTEKNNNEEKREENNSNMILWWRYFFAPKNN